MIEKISIKIANTPQIAGALSSDDRELYAYGFFILISKMVFGILTVLFGMIFGMVIECTIFGNLVKLDKICTIFKNLTAYKK